MKSTKRSAENRHVPTYKLEEGAQWFHFLHGNVPGHQIDYIIRPEIPQGPLTPQHFSHLSRLMKYIEPRHANAYAFAIANLSRDDTQYEPGHGGIALIFGLRIQGAKDHAGRQDPPFCHATAAINRHLDGPMLHAAAIEFYRKLLPNNGSQAEGSGWYHSYVQCAQNANALDPLLKSYLADFNSLPIPGPSGLSLCWTVEGTTPPRRVVIVYADETDFDTLARCMAQIAQVVVESDIKWTAISNGRESDVAGGLTVRFVPQSEMVSEAGDVVVINLEEVPENAADIANQLFHARAVVRTKPSADRIHRRYVESEVVTPKNEMPRLDLPAVVDVGPPIADLATELKRKQRKSQFTTVMGFSVLIVAFGILAAIWLGSAPKPVADALAVGAPASATVAAASPTSSVIVKPSASVPNDAGPATTNSPRKVGPGKTKKRLVKKGPFGGKL